jgi:hypothetical protein
MRVEHEEPRRSGRPVPLRAAPGHIRQAPVVPGRRAGHGTPRRSVERGSGGPFRAVEAGVLHSSDDADAVPLGLVMGRKTTLGRGQGRADEAGSADAAACVRLSWVRVCRTQVLCMCHVVLGGCWISGVVTSVHGLGVLCMLPGPRMLNWIAFVRSHVACHGRGLGHCGQPIAGSTHAARHHAGGRVALQGQGQQQQRGKPGTTACGQVQHRSKSKAGGMAGRKRGLVHGAASAAAYRPCRTRLADSAWRKVSAASAR